jgi:hypothetical protein
MSVCVTEKDVGRPLSAFFNSPRVNAPTAVTQALPKRPESGVHCDKPLFRYISVTLGKCAPSTGCRGRRLIKLSVSFVSIFCCTLSTSNAKSRSRLKW